MSDDVAAQGYIIPLAT